MLLFYIEKPIKELIMSENPLKNLTPKEFWKYFSEISQIPRCSGDEEAIRAYLVAQAERRGLEHREDEAGNVLIRVPAAKGCEKRPIAVIQGHIDMVCEKNSACGHDFSSDPLQLVLEGDSLRAEGTTLGADDGIALAMGLALLDTDAPHGPLELLFTSDEERGLTGALNLDTSLIEGRKLFNLDSEEEGVFYIGCAGGVTTVGDLPVEWSNNVGNSTVFSLSVTGLRGGHSGANIHLGRANAVKLGARLLWNLKEQLPIRLMKIHGGSKQNAVAREFFASFAAAENQREQVHEAVRRWEAVFRTEYGDVDPDIRLRIEELDEKPEKTLSPKTTNSTIDALYLIPHGVDEYSRSIEGLVETSTNLASVELRDYDVRIVTSQRSSMTTKRDDICARVSAAMKSAGAKVNYIAPYPAWTPDPRNPLIELCRGAYRELFSKEATVTAIHAGLEAGVIGDKFEGMEMISLGPDLEDVHTPNEHLSVSSAERTWKLLLRILENLR